MRLVVLGMVCLWGCDNATAQTTVSYATPPKCQIWLEGEDCREHNWVAGPAMNCWAFEWAGVHGGVLDLAAWRLPPEGCYYARFPFTVTVDDEYVLYWLGRLPGAALGSPIEWSVDGGPATEVRSSDGWNAPVQLAVVAKFKYGLVRLGTFRVTAGGGR